MASLKKVLKNKEYQPIPLQLTATNHLRLKAKINGVPGLFILDTGASNTCVSMDKADYFQLSFIESDIKAAGAGAVDMETHISKKNMLEIGFWENKKQAIILFDLSHVNEALIMHNAESVDGIIGADVLKKSKAIITYKEPVLYLKNKKKQGS